MSKKISLLLLSCLLCFASCKKEQKLEKEALQYISKQSLFLAQINDMETFREKMDSSEIWQNYKQLDIVEAVKESFSTLYYIKTDKRVLFNCIDTGKNDFNFLFIFESSQSENFSFKQEQKTKGSTYDKVLINTYAVNKQNYYSTQLGKYSLISTKKSLIENAIRQKDRRSDIDKNANFNKSFKSADLENYANLFINGKELEKLYKSTKVKGLSILVNFSDWSALDLNFKKEKLQGAGLNSSYDSIPKFNQLFRNSEGSTSKGDLICPANALGFKQFNYGNYTQFKKEVQNYKEFYNYKEIKDTKFSDSLFKLSNSLSLVHLKKDRIVGLHSIAIEKTIQLLEANSSKEEKYRHFYIRKLKDAYLWNKTFSVLDLKQDSNYFSVYKEQVLFAENKEALKDLLNAIINKNTLADKKYYEETKEILSETASVLLVAINEVFFKEIGIKHPKNIFDKQKLSILQLSNDGINSFNNLITTTIDPSIEKTTEINQKWNAKTDAKITYKPQLVKNHRTGNKEVICQDEKHKLYLFSNTGKLLWEKQLDGPILGDIGQIDILRNKKLQYAFATTKSIYVVDRLGNNVSGISKTLNNPMTQGLAVFDYDKNRKYRFLVTQKTALNLFDAKGEKVKGFDFKQSKTNIDRVAKHFVSKTKDYICITEESGKIHLVNRQGKIRTKTAEAFKISANEIYQNNGDIVFSTTDKKLVNLDLKTGNSNTSSLDANEDHYYNKAKNTAIIFNENELRIGDNTTKLDLGIHSKLSVLKGKNKSYIAITNLESHKIYLFDSDGTAVDNFPVFGSSISDLAWKKDRILLTCLGEKDEVLLYEIKL